MTPAGIRIGIDASWACGERTGTGVFTRDIVRGLLELDQRNTYVLYFRSCCKEHNPVYAMAEGRAERHIVDHRLTVLRSLFGLSRAIRCDGLDLFYSTGYFLPSFVPCARLVTFHDLQIFRLARHWVRPGRTIDMLIMRTVMSLSAHVADYIVVDSEASDADLVERFPSVRGRSSVVYNGCDLSRFGPLNGTSEMLSTPARQPYFLYVGVMSPTKNLARLIQAFARFKNHDERGFSLALAGRECGNHMVSKLLPLIRALGVESWVKWVGFVSDSELGRLYRNAYALALPSLGEGFGYPLVEAMGMGVPILTSNVSSCPEVAGDAGICVDPLSVDAITRALVRLATDEPERQRLIACGKARCRLFTVERMAADYLALIERLASERPRPGARQGTLERTSGRGKNARVRD